MTCTRRGAALVSVLLLSTAAPCLAQKPKVTPKKPVPQNQTKGQGQLQGGNGQFGTVYTLTSNFNFEIVGARYTLEPFNAYTVVTAGTDKKLLVLDIAVKNVSTSDNFFNPDSMFTLVDEKGQLYNGGSLALQSKAADSGSFTLRPGQGQGQPALKDPLQIAWELPAKARIVKIMINQARQGRKEEVFRYYIAGATKAEAGEAGDPKNVITPLPAESRDPADASGSSPLDESKGAPGVYVPSGYFNIRFDGLTYSTEPLNGNPPEDGKKFAIATVTAKNPLDKGVGMFDAEGGDSPLYEITDADGEHYKPVFYRKAKRDEDAEHDFKKGDEYTFRVVFQMPKDAVAKKLVLGTGAAHKWAYDVSAVK